MLMGMSPALSQAAFRIGDSATGVITPMNPYLFLILAMVRQYEPEARLGTLISRLAIFVVPSWRCGWRSWGSSTDSTCRWAPVRPSA